MGAGCLQRALGNSSELSPADAVKVIRMSTRAVKPNQRMSFGFLQDSRAFRQISCPSLLFLLPLFGATQPGLQGSPSGCLSIKVLLLKPVT